MLDDVKSLINGYLSWIEYDESPEYIEIIPQYMNKNHGKSIILMLRNTRIFAIGYYNFKRGIKCGVAESRYISGQIHSLYYYKRNKIVGTHKIWYENGNLECKTTYVDGYPNGPQTIWFPDGRIRCENYYVGRPAY